MREIVEFLDGNFAQALAGICAQTKTAAAWSVENFQTEAAQKNSKIFIITESENNKKTRTNRAYYLNCLIKYPNF